MFKKRIGILLVGIMTASMMLVGCGNTSLTSRITISGSSSVGPLMELQAEEFKGNNEDLSIEINQLGSSAGIKDAITGVAQIGMTSRDLKDREKKEGLKEVEIAFDGISLIVNKNNPVKNLTIEQIKDIYTGKITNWKDVGGKDSPIVVVSREDGSGTRDAFQEIIGYSSENLVKDAQISDGSGNIKVTVTDNENAIGFISFSYVDDTVTSLLVNNVAPTADNVKNGTYKVSRPFLLTYKEGSLSEHSKQFIDFILSKKGQELVKAEGLITIN
ncbi:MAG: phosphate ABC transporter substrate-binding protein [Sarcina sp.]